MQHQFETFFLIIYLVQSNSKTIGKLEGMVKKIIIQIKDRNFDNQ